MPDGRTIPGAIAVPVQMIEAWLLLMHAPETYIHEAQLPAFARRDQPAARERLGDRAPPQLKDLVDLERGTSSKADFALACILKLDPADLARRAPSYARFDARIRGWGPVGG